MIHKAEQLGYHPALIGAGRRINDNMGVFVANKIIKLMINKGIQVKGAKALILGFTFKENCPDIRNTRVIDICNELSLFGLNVDVYDPWAEKEEILHEHDLSLLDTISNKYDVILLAVAHNEFKFLDFSQLKNNNSVIYDIKSYLGQDVVDDRL
jgi:UDP-N-acetyl-D-galactosamine dehydrogenase